VRFENVTCSGDQLEDVRKAMSVFVLKTAWLQLFQRGDIA
jgi:hypothetical protein